jgi:hypothetical protein
MPNELAGPIIPNSNMEGHGSSEPVAISEGSEIFNSSGETIQPVYRKEDLLDSASFETIAPTPFCSLASHSSMQH